MILRILLCAAMLPASFGVGLLAFPNGSGDAAPAVTYGETTVPAYVDPHGEAVDAYTQACEHISGGTEGCTQDDAERAVSTLEGAR